MIDFAGKHVTVMGLGRFGGGIGVTRFLASQGARVLVTDTTAADQLADSVAQIKDLVDRGSVTLRLGEHVESDFTDADVVVANAAVPRPWDDRFLAAAKNAGKLVTTEIALAVERLPRGAKTVGITGSVGKSTTTAMIAHMLKHAGLDVVMGGNIGGSLLADLASGRITVDTRVVLELSSAMLYWLERVLAHDSRGFAPSVAVVTNFSPNHLDWHGELTHYRTSKQALIAHQGAEQTAVLGAGVVAWRTGTRARVVVVDEPFAGPMLLPGEHNRVNARAALHACAALEPGVNARVFEDALASFGGLVHRLQIVRRASRRAGEEPMLFFNDSKSTTPESTLTAIKAVAQMPGSSLSRVHLIAGGYDKGSDLSAIGRLGAELAGLYTVGKTGPAIASAAGGRAVECGTVEVATAQAFDRMKPGDVLLLSPGCASWGQFVNFEARGELFIRLVRELPLVDA